MSDQNIYERLIAARDSIQPVQKDAENEFHHYKYVSAAAIEQAARDALIPQGLGILCNYRDKRLSDDKVKSTAVLTVYDEAGNRIENAATASMHGVDKGDKAIAKAQTGARKYALMSLLMIPSVDDPEADVKTDKAVARNFPVNPQAQNPPSAQPAPRPQPSRQPTPVDPKWFPGKLTYVKLDEGAHSARGVVCVDVTDVDLPDFIRNNVKSNKYGDSLWLASFEYDIYGHAFAIAGFEPTTPPASVIGFAQAVKPAVEVEFCVQQSGNYLNLAGIRYPESYDEPDPDELGPPLDFDPGPLSPGE